MMDDPMLGCRMNVGMFSFSGSITYEQTVMVAQAVIEAAEMEQAYPSACWNYPTPRGRGGKGITYVTPITTSFLAIDTWPDKGGFFVFLCSCKPFSLYAILDAVERFGFLRYQTSHDVLWLPGVHSGILENEGIKNWTEVGR